jgi:hypothetical protein
MDQKASGQSSDRTNVYQNTMHIRNGTKSTDFFGDSSAIVLSEQHEER